MALRSGHDLDSPASACTVPCARQAWKASGSGCRRSVWSTALSDTDRLDVAVADDRQAVERALQVALTEWIE
jgi:hypothetical protein